MEEMKKQGSTWGYNSRLDNLQAAILAKAQTYPKDIEHRRKIATI